MRLLSCLILLVSGCYAQLNDLAATDDGSELYFASPLRQRGSEQFLHSKIFRWTPDGFELVLQNERTGGVFPAFTPLRLHAPDVSGDGRVATAVATGGCRRSGSSCFLTVVSDSPVLLKSDLDRPPGAGAIQVSRSGRFLLTRGFSNLRGREPKRRTNLETGEVTPIEHPGYPAGDRQSITRQGWVLLHRSGKLTLWRDDMEPAEIEIGERVWTAVVSDDGTQIVYEKLLPRRGTELWSIRPDGSNQVRIGLVQRGPFHPAISNDGRWAVFVAQGRVVLADLVAGSQTLLSTADSVTAVTISGDGSVVFAGSAEGVLWRIDVVSRAVAELAATTGAVAKVDGGGAPGSLNWIRGWGLARERRVAVPPYPRALDGVRVEIGGADAAIVAVAPDRIVYQIPWEAELGDTEIRVFGPANSGEFEWPKLLKLRETSLDFISAGSEVDAPGLSLGATTIADQRFQSLITEANPSHPGDIVHVYATGLGPVAAPPATGALSPAEPLPAIWGIRCRSENLSRRIPSLYAGLAPGFVGIYQVTLQIPMDAFETGSIADDGYFRLRCGSVLQAPLAIPVAAR